MAQKFTPRGRSRIDSSRIAPSWDNEALAFIPMEGGDRSIQPLPPLLLSYDEWATIGKRMKWWAKRHDAISKQRRAANELESLTLDQAKPGEM